MIILIVLSILYVLHDLLVSFIVVICLLIVFIILVALFFLFKQKTAYERRISDWSSDVCSSDLPASPTKDTAMLTARVDRELLAAFDAVAEGRGGRSALLRTVLQQSLKHVADAPRIAPRADSPSNRVNLRFTDVETAVLDHRAAQRGVDRAGWIKALV